MNTVKAITGSQEDTKKLTVQHTYQSLITHTSQYKYYINRRNMQETISSQYF